MKTILLYVNTVLCSLMLCASFPVFSFVSSYQSKFMGGMPATVCEKRPMQVMGVSLTHDDMRPCTSGNTRSTSEYNIRKQIPHVHKRRM